MVKRVVEALRAYVPEPVPLDQSELVRYIDQELMRIAETLQPLADTFSPEISGAMLNPVFSGEIGLLQTAIGDYQNKNESEAFSYADIVSNLLTGKYEFGLESSDMVLVHFQCAINVTLDPSMVHNQSIILEIDNGFGGYELIATGSILSQNQEFVMLSGSRILELPGNTQVGLSLRMSETAGTPQGLSGDYEIRLIDIVDQYQSYKNK